MDLHDLWIQNDLKAGNRYVALQQRNDEMMVHAAVDLSTGLTSAFGKIAGAMTGNPFVPICFQLTEQWVGKAAKAFAMQDHNPYRPYEHNWTSSYQTSDPFHDQITTANFTHHYQVKPTETTRQMGVQTGQSHIDKLTNGIKPNLQPWTSSTSTTSTTFERFHSGTIDRSQNVQQRPSTDFGQNNIGTQQIQSDIRQSQPTFNQNSFSTPSFSNPSGY